VHIAIAKPDWGIRGGFEVVVDRVVEHLESIGHVVSWLTVEVNDRPPSIHGLEIPDDVRDDAAEYFRYVGVAERFHQLDARRADAVLCTQPGSWAVRHRHKLALFYHHLRMFYDLSDDYVAAGFVVPSLHEACVDALRSVDRPLLGSVAHFLTPSREVDDRLQRFNDVGTDRRSPFLAGQALTVPPEPGTAPADGTVLCVSRHEWPKRTELLVSAAHHLLAEPAPPSVVLVGSGGRIEHVRALDRRLRREGCVADDRTLWLPAALHHEPDGPGAPNLSVLGRVDDDELHSCYRDALCVVAPALRED
jgi:glycosyltransferase involved in cell wall biosynthesis